jgi:MarR family transcriptional regulator, organic hydroperoxide resistance regulator
MRSNREKSLGFSAVPAMGPVLEFMRVVWSLDHALQKTSKRMETTLGITAPQRLVIRILGRFPGMSAGLLAIILRLHPSTLTGVLKRLQQQGLITRRADPRDRRRAVLGLTTMGRALDVDAEGTVEAAVRTAFEEIPKTKIKDALEVFQKLTDLLERRNSRVN